MARFEIKGSTGSTRSTRRAGQSSSSWLWTARTLLGVLQVARLQAGQATEAMAVTTAAIVERAVAISMQLRAWRLT